MSDALRKLRIILTTLGVVVILLQGTTASAGAAARTSIDASASVAPGRLTVEGRLTTGNKGVGDATVTILLDGGEAATPTTNGNGEFRTGIDVSSDASGRARITVLFAGNDGFAPSQKNLTVTLEPRPQQTATETPAETQRPSTPTQARATASLSLTLDPGSAYPGDVLTLTGRLSSPSGSVGDVPIHFSIAGSEQPDSLTTTDSKGNYSTFLEVPTDLKPGSVRVEAVYNGSGTVTAASQTARVEIKEVVVEPTPTPEATTATPEPSPEPTLTTAPEPTLSTPLAEQNNTPATPPANWGWVVVTIIATGGVALLTVVGLLLRRHTAAVHVDDDSFQLLGHADPEPGADPDAAPGADPRPRRGV